MNRKQLLTIITTELDQLQAIDCKILNVSKLTSVTDHMVICSGRSSRHVKAIAENLLEKIKKKGLQALSQSGITAGEWALIDYGDVIIHVMKPDIRDFYNLEGLWSEMPTQEDSDN